MRKFRCPFGICIAFSILAVIGCDFFCKLGLISFSHHKSQVVVASSSHTHEKSHHDEDHHHLHSPGTSTNHNAEPANHDEGEDGCCSDLTQQFYSSLINPASASLDLIHVEAFRLISVFIQSDLSEQKLFSTLPLTSIFDHRPNGPPGVAGHRIRVLFCSFLI